MKCDYEKSSPFILHIFLVIHLLKLVKVYFACLETLLPLKIINDDSIYSKTQFYVLSSVPSTDKWSQGSRRPGAVVIDKLMIFMMFWVTVSNDVREMQRLLCKILLCVCYYSYWLWHKGISKVSRENLLELFWI